MKRILALILVLCAASVANAQQVVKSTITHVNGVPLAKPIVEFDHTQGMRSSCDCQHTGVCSCGDNCQCSVRINRPPLVKYEERIVIRGNPVGVTVQTQRPFVQVTSPQRKTGHWVCKGTHCEWVAE